MVGMFSFTAERWLKEGLLAESPYPLFDVATPKECYRLRFRWPPCCMYAAAALLSLQTFAPRSPASGSCGRNRINVAQLPALRGNPTTAGYCTPVTGDSAVARQRFQLITVNY